MPLLSKQVGDKRESLHVQMEGTEVPNPRRSSACVCCLTTIDHSAASSVLVPPLAIALPRDSLMFAMRIVLFLPMQSSLTSF